jgi:hypothetical protein
MAASIKSLEQVRIPDTYVLENGEYIKETDSFALLLRHKVSGARVLFMSNTDDNKVFSIGFRTPPADDTGVPHIIEHTVLCGSREFPAKDPFVELVKGSLNTYLNATTYPDKTLYPVASCNQKDFENLMHVYMDAVFYPNIYLREEIFKQEGWHYELDDPEGSVTYNGVVFNEMKGAFSSAAGKLERFVMNHLFPDNTYSCESGGDPEKIPDLTYEEYLDFHRRYYHPVNSYIYLYGDMDVEERLIWMDEHYLKDFPAIALDSSIPLQKPFTAIKRYHTEFAASESEDCSEKTYYSYAAAMDVTLDVKVCKAFEVLAYVLVEMPGAPLKQALLDAGLGTDIDVDFCDILRQSYFSITTQNAKPGELEKFYRIIEETLQKQVKQGVDRKALEAALNAMEFKEREGDYGNFPKGLIYGLNAMKTWLYDDNMPYAALCYEESYRFLREKLSTDYFEELIQTYLLDNSHGVLVEMNPKQGLAAIQEEQEKKRLAEYKASLSEEEVLQLIQDTKSLKQYQEEPSSKEDLEKIPMLSREDIGKKIQPIYNQEITLSGVSAVHHDINTNDIVYLDLLFDMEDLTGYIPQISFLKTLLGYMDTRKHTYKELDTEINFHTGGIGTDVNFYRIYDTQDEYNVRFEASTKVLRSKLPEALDLMSEVLFETLFTDDKHLREVVAEARSRKKMSLMSAGHQAAMTRALSHLSCIGWMTDMYAGYGYYQYLSQLDDHFEEEKEKLKEGCRMLTQKLFRREHLTISCTGDQECIRELEKSLPVFLNRLDEFERQNDSQKTEEILKRYVPQKGQVNEGIMTPSEIQYVALAGCCKDMSQIKKGVLDVVRHMLNYGYLWNEVRVKGGAYGVFCQFMRNGEGFFTSYRDPGLGETLEVYRRSAAYLQEIDMEERELLKTIIGTISGIDTPKTPAGKGKRSMTILLSKLPPEVLQEERNQILSCTGEDIRSIAGMLKEIVENSNICVIGNEQHLQQSKQLFDTLVTL